MSFVITNEASASSGSSQARPQISNQAFLKLAEARAGGDIDHIRKRGFLRVLVVANKTHYLVDRGRQFGLAFDMVRDFEKYINKTVLKKQNKYLPVVFIPVHRDQIFSRLSENRGDIAVANLTVTDERSLSADFSVPFIDNAREIVAASPRAMPIQSIDDLSGKAVYVRKSSSFYSHLLSLNADLASRNQQAIQIVTAEEHLEAEDLMEMLNAGLIEYSIIDQHIGEVWARVFPNVVLHRDIVISSGQKIAWAMRKNMPQLKDAVNGFMATHDQTSRVGRDIFFRYLKNTKWVKNASGQNDLERFNRTIGYFREYARRYEFDPLMLAAQGFQESGLDQTQKSRVGAIGVMQLMPATGKELKVGDITEEAANIHGGAKYMRQLIDRNFKDQDIDDFNRTLFAFASYNAGPQRVKALRKEAKKMNLDPNVWFDNVETVAALHVGRETLQYVSNISKYYIAYKLIAEQGKNGLMSEKD